MRIAVQKLALACYFPREKKPDPVIPLFLDDVCQAHAAPRTLIHSIHQNHSMSLAPAAAAGFQNASAYDAHRPAYPPAAVEKLLAHMRLAGRPHARVVEVAAGTGKFTEALAAREEGFEVLATEPQ